MAVEKSIHRFAEMTSLVEAKERSAAGKGEGGGRTLGYTDVADSTGGTEALLIYVKQ